MKLTRKASGEARLALGEAVVSFKRS